MATGPKKVNLYDLRLLKNQFSDVLYFSGLRPRVAKRCAYR